MNSNLRHTVALSVAISVLLGAPAAIAASKIVHNHKILSDSTQSTPAPALRTTNAASVSLDTSLPTPAATAPTNAPTAEGSAPTSTPAPTTSTPAPTTSTPAPANPTFAAPSSSVSGDDDGDGDDDDFGTDGGEDNESDDD